MCYLRKLIHYNIDQILLYNIKPMITSQFTFYSYLLD